MQNKTSFPLTCAAACFALSVAAPSLALGQVVAAFESGTGTATSDQFVGSAGNGWADAWQVNARTGGNNASQILDTINPISGTGSLLVESNRTPGTGGSATRSNAGRAIDGIDVAAPFTIAFDFRLDSLDGTNEFGDYVIFFLRGDFNSASNFNAGAGAFRIVGDLGTPEFQYRSGNSTIALPSADIDFGTVYTYAANINPVDQTWSFSLSGGSVDETVTDLSFGNGNAGISVAHWGTSIQTDNALGTEDIVNAWTIDNIVISAPIPEPSSATFFGALMVLLAMVRSRR